MRLATSATPERTSGFVIVDIGYSGSNWPIASKRVVIGNVVGNEAFIPNELFEFGVQVTVTKNDYASGKVTKEWTSKVGVSNIKESGLVGKKTYELSFTVNTKTIIQQFRSKKKMVKIRLSINIPSKYESSSYGSYGSSYESDYTRGFRLDDVRTDADTDRITFPSEDGLDWHIDPTSLLGPSKPDEEEKDDETDIEIEDEEDEEEKQIIELPPGSSSYGLGGGI